MGERRGEAGDGGDGGDAGGGSDAGAAPGDVVPSVTVWRALMLAYLLFLAYPVSALVAFLDGPPDGLPARLPPGWSPATVVVAGMVALGAFVAGYLRLMWTPAWARASVRQPRRPPTGPSTGPAVDPMAGRSSLVPPVRPPRGVLAGLAALTGIAVAGTAVFGSGWAGLPIYVALAAGAWLPFRWTLPLSAALGLLAAGLAAAGGDPPIDAAILAVIATGGGVGMAGWMWLTGFVVELRAARAEVARLAVERERLRFARDLHDLLGHSLSLVAIKSELARRLLPRDPERAAREVADVEAVAREALAEVREAVGGYRRGDLAVELRRARMALRAAGVEPSVDVDAGDVGDLPPDAEAALAWAVREGVTNVARHAEAARCAVRVRRVPGAVVVEVVDDGAGVPGAGPAVAATAGAVQGSVPGGDRARDGAGTDAGTGPGPGREPRSDGHGLTGLAERAGALGGRMEAGPVPPGGFALRVTIPVPDDRIEERDGNGHGEVPGGTGRGEDHDDDHGGTGRGAAVPGGPGARPASAAPRPPSPAPASPVTAR